MRIRCQGLGHYADRRRDHDRAVLVEAAAHGLAEFLGRRRAPPNGAERFGQADEIGVVQIGGYDFAAIGLDLLALDVAEGVVAEDDRDYADALLDGGGKLLRVVEEPAVARDREDRPVQM